MMPFHRLAASFPAGAIWTPIFTNDGVRIVQHHPGVAKPGDKEQYAGRGPLRCKMQADSPASRARLGKRQMIREFFKIIDWMMELPDELANKLSDFVVELEEKEKMEYVTTIARHIRAKERQEERREGWEGGKQEGASEMLLHLLIVKQSNNMRVNQPK